MLDPNIRDNHLCLGIRVDERPDGEILGEIKESVIIEPISANNGRVKFKLLTIRYEGNVGYRGPDLEVEFDLNK